MLLPSRLLAGLGALACAAGIVAAAGAPASAAASSAASATAASTTARSAAAASTTAANVKAASATAASSTAAAGSSAAASGGRKLPPHVFAPYYAGGSAGLASTATAAGDTYLTIAFLQTAKPGSCTVDWNGDPKTPVGQPFAAGIAAIQKSGGQVVPSFGGAYADSVDEEIADSCHSVAKIAAQYEKVITTYHVTRLDLDTEEDSLNNYAGINRRNEAIAMVEHWAARTHRTVQFVYTIPTNATGIDQGGSVVLQNAVAHHVRIAIVDIMTFDYYDNLPHEMADNTEGAAQQLFDRLHELYPAKTSGPALGHDRHLRGPGRRRLRPRRDVHARRRAHGRAVGRGEGSRRAVVLERAGRQHRRQSREAVEVRLRPHLRAVHQHGEDCGRGTAGRRCLPGPGTRSPER